MLIGRKESFLRKGYNYNIGATVVEQERNDGSIYCSVVIASGPYIPGKGKSFEDLCKEWNVEENRVLRERSIS